MNVAKVLKFCLNWQKI